MDNDIISDLNDAADKARSEVEYYKDMMIRSWLGKLKWDEEQGIFVREFQSKKKEAMKKDDLLKKQGFLVNDDFESLFPPLDGKGKVVCKNQMTKDDKDDKDDIDIDSMMIGFWNQRIEDHFEDVLEMVFNGINTPTLILLLI